MLTVATVSQRIGPNNRKHITFGHSKVATSKIDSSCNSKKNWWHLQNTDIPHDFTDI